MIIENEIAIRLGFFVGIFVFMASWELIAPRRDLSTSKALRWFTNIGIVVINTIVVRLFFSAAAVGFAVLTAQNSWGVLNQVAWFPCLEGLLSVIVLDFIIYLQHVMFHAIPVLWRLHMVHHADLDLDVTSGARFHPIEIVLSMGIKLASIVLIGASAEAVVIFEVLLNVTAMFNHSNVRIPKQLDQLLRWIIVTPDMHVIHHSVNREETNRNFGFNLPWWDRLLGTYLPEPQKGYMGMTIGLEQFRNPERLSLVKILMLPFFGNTGGYTFTQDEQGKPKKLDE